jgi:hypothetical protein
MVAVMLLVLLSLLSGGAAEGNRLESAIDWASFLGRSDMQWPELPQDYEHGAYTGNGRLGANCWQDPDGSLGFEISRSDLYDHRRRDKGYSVLFATYRLPNGQLHFTLPGGKPKGRLRLDLWNAEMSGQLENSAGRLALRAYTHATEPVLVIETTGLAPVIDFRPVPARSYRTIMKPPPDYAAYPPQTRMEVEDIAVSVQEMPEDARYHTEGQGIGQYATAWRTVELGNERRVTFVALGFSYPGRTAVAEAVSAVRGAVKSSPAALTESHRRWWHEFYPRSFVSFPDPELESYYWIQMYRMGSVSRPDGPIVDLMGPWYLKSTSWPAVWWNLNLQLTYWPYYTANHVDLTSPLVNTLWSHRRELAANAAPHSDDSYAIARCSALDCSTGHGHELGNLPWVMHNLWLQYRVTMDDALLREKIFPLMKGSFNYLSHLLLERADGKLHLPASGSPEYTESVEDCNYSAACLRWLAGTIIAADDRLHLHDPVTTRCREVLARMAPYAVDDTGFMVGKDMPFVKSHRHWSHLFMIYPFHEWSFDDAAQAPMVEKSLQNWLGKPAGFRGFSFAAAASMENLAQRGDAAVNALHDFLAFNGCLPNGLYREPGGPCMESPMFAARAVQELMLTSYGNLIRVFPGVPNAWTNAVFADFRAEGAFLVSALRRDGVTRAVQIRSLAGESCRVRPNLAGPVKASGKRTFQLKESPGGIVEVDLRKGESVLLYSGDQPPDFKIAPVVLPASPVRWGGEKPVPSKPKIKGAA